MLYFLTIFHQFLLPKIDENVWKNALQTALTEKGRYPDFARQYSTFQWFFKGRTMKNQRKNCTKKGSKVIKKITSLLISLWSIFGPKIDPKIDKNEAKKWSKKGMQKKMQKKRKKSPTWAALACKPDLARETESANWRRWPRSVKRCVQKSLFESFWETLRGGTRGSALGTAAGRDTVERAGKRCGAGYDGSRCWEI